MNRARCLAVACLAVAGCATPSLYMPVEQAAGSPTAAPAPRGHVGGRVGVAAPSSPSPGAAPAPSPGHAAQAEAAEPVERPGLGTLFGETRGSRVHEVAFERGDERPFSVATIYYNDTAGVNAMVSYDLRERSRVDAPVAVRGGLTASVVDQSGAPLQAMSVGGRVYVVGEAGRRYGLRIENHTPRRYEAVVSVDGLDVVDGQPASVEKRGYVIDPYASLTIDGFRRSFEEVAAFRFGPVSQSYAAKTSGDRNVGVIGMAFFAEQGAAPWDDGEVELRRTAEPFSDARFARPPAP